MTDEIIGSVILTLKVILVVIIPLIGFALGISYISMTKNKLVNNIIELVVNIPLIFPPIGIGFILVSTFSRNSYLGKLLKIDLIFSFSGISIAAFLAGIPFITRAVLVGIKGGIYDLCDVSYTLGKEKLETFIKIVVPGLRKNILQGLILAIGRIIGEVGMSLMIGGNIPGKTNTISLEIYNSVLDGEEGKAMVLSVILFVFSFTIFSILKFLDKER